MAERIPETTIAMLLSLESFEGFYGGVMRLSRTAYLETYRNDFSFMYAQALAEQDVDVIIYLPTFEDAALHRVQPGVSVRFLKIDRWYRLWRRFPFLAKSPVGRYVAQVANTIAFSSDLKASLSTDKVDVIYMQEYWTGRFDRLASWSPVPVIGADHGGRKDRQLTFRKAKTFARAAALTCQTENECASVRSFGVEPVLLPNGIDTLFFTPGEVALAKPQTVLIVARLNDPQKRFSDLIRSLMHLPAQWKLQIAGTGPDEAMLKDLVQQLKLENRVDFLGFVAGKPAVRELYRNCGVYAMPSSVEGIPLAILEAMSCQCACVVSEIRAYSMIEDGVNGYKVPVGAPEALAAAILKAYANRASIGIRARQTVEATFSLKPMASRLKQLILRAGKNL